MTRCPDCRRNLVDGACPQGCERFRRRVWREQREDREARRAQRKVEIRENALGLHGRTVSAPLPFAHGTSGAVGGEHAPYMHRPLSVCPTCGSPVRPRRGSLPAACAQCGPLVVEVAS